METFAKILIGVLMWSTISIWSILGIIFIIKLIKTNTNQYKPTIKKNENISNNHHYLFAVKSEKWFKDHVFNIEISKYQYTQNFQSFPFLLDLEQLKNELKEMKIKKKKVNKIIQEIKFQQQEILNWFYSFEDDFIWYFNIQIQHNSMTLNEAWIKYEHFLTFYYQTLIDNYYNKLLEFYLDKANKKIFFKVYTNYSKKLFHNFLDVIIYYITNDFKSYDEEFDDSNFMNDKLVWAYSILEIDKDATIKEIKFSYRQLAKKYHPDVNDSNQTNEKMQQINQAYFLIKKHLNF